LIRIDKIEKAFQCLKRFFYFALSERDTDEYADKSLLSLFEKLFTSFELLFLREFACMNV